MQVNGEGNRRGLAPFDQPLYLQFHDDERAETEALASSTAFVSRYSSVGRVVLAVVLIAIAPTRSSDPDTVRTFGYLVSFGWLGVIGVIDLIRWRRPHSRALEVATLLWDLALCAAAQLVLEAPATTAVVCVLVITYHAYVSGAVLGIAATALAAGVLIGLPYAEGETIYWSVVVSNLTVAALLVWMATEASHRQARVRAGLVRVSEKADAILAGIGDAVFVTNNTGRVTEWNRAAARTFTSDSERAVGHRCGDLLDLHQEMRDIHCERSCGLLDLVGAGTDVEVWRTDAQGRRQPLLATVQPVVARDGTPIEVIHSFRDVTSLKQADEAKTLFLATASHELKTPLTVIRGYAQMLQRPEVNDEEVHTQALMAIDSRAQQLSGIVDRLLMSSRIEAGHIELVPVPTLIGPLVLERAEAVEGATGRVVICDVDDELPRVHADSNAVTTVLDHLLDNAIKYSADDSLIVMSATATAEHVVVAVRDHGIGMTPDQLEHCFDRFWQAESTDVRRFGGTGIGLYIVRSLVDAMGGDLEVDSTAGEGTEFTMRLWRADRADLGAGERDGEEPHEEGADAQPSMIREFMRQMGIRLDHSGSPR